MTTSGRRFRAFRRTWSSWTWRTPSPRRARARPVERAFAALQDRSWFGEKLVLARPNHLSTPWGLEDLDGARRGWSRLPRLPEDPDGRGHLDVVDVLSRLGVAPDLFAIIETAGSIP